MVARTSLNATSHVHCLSCNQDGVTSINVSHSVVMGGTQNGAHRTKSHGRHVRRSDTAASKPTGRSPGSLRASRPWHVRQIRTNKNWKVITYPLHSRDVRNQPTKPTHEPSKDEGQAVLFKDSVRTAQWTLLNSVIKTNQFML